MSPTLSNPTVKKIICNSGVATLASQTARLAELGAFSDAQLEAMVEADTLWRTVMEAVAFERVPAEKVSAALAQMETILEGTLA